MTKKTASKKTASQEQDTNAKEIDRVAVKVVEEDKKQETADKAELKPKAKRKGRTSKKKSAQKPKTGGEPLAEKEQKQEGAAMAKQENKPEPAEAKPKRAKKKKAAPKGELVKQEAGQRAEARNSEAQQAAEKPAAKPKPKARRSAKKGSKAKGGRNAAEAPEPSGGADKGMEVVKQEAKRGNHVVVASRNPAKIKAAELGFSRMFPDQEFVFDGISVASGVADQPMTDDETFMGALHRALTAQQEQPEADYWIGLEGGLQEEGDDFYAFAWIVLIGPKGMQGKSRTGTFVLPLEVAELVRDGKELGEADDIIFGKTNSKLSSGAIGILTHGLIDRAEYYAGAVAMALIPFKNPELYAVEDTLIEVEV
ncbi:inosine/xanthosine triphosphatase [Nafulsella turpanensis]|uniref:inosine/xanthosine triphosphatase n=1 Tax=Nafulsella turpanensis TaxID=1265690 RepID=UPI000345FAAE|nr:inosine/xanthosine triphosphatase [Nafulsella turpanensis]